MNDNIIQITISVITILVSIGGSLLVIVFKAGRQSKEIEEIKIKVNVLSDKVDKLSDVVMQLSKEFAYFKGLVEGKLFAQRKEKE